MTGRSLRPIKGHPIHFVPHSNYFYDGIVWTALETLRNRTAQAWGRQKWRRSSDVVSGLVYRPVAVEDVRQAVLTSGRKREYICRKKIDVIFGAGVPSCCVRSLLFHADPILQRKTETIQPALFIYEYTIKTLLCIKFAKCILLRINFYSQPYLCGYTSRKSYDELFS